MMQIRARINRIKGYKNLDLIKQELFALLSTIILDRKFFSPNLALRPFLQMYSIELGYNFDKDYLFGSRYDVLAKVIKGIENLDEDRFDKLIEKLVIFCEVVDPIVEKSDSAKTYSKDLEDMLRKFER